MKSVELPMHSFIRQWLDEVCLIHYFTDSVKVLKKPHHNTITYENGEVEMGGKCQSGHMFASLGQKHNVGYRTSSMAMSHTKLKLQLLDKSFCIDSLSHTSINIPWRLMALFH